MFSSFNKRVILIILIAGHVKHIYAQEPPECKGQSYHFTCDYYKPEDQMNCIDFCERKGCKSGACHEEPNPKKQSCLCAY